MSLTAKVLWAMLLGIIVGLVINIAGLNTPESFTNEYVVGGLFYIMGKMFITALKMLVVPLIFFSLISGVLGIGLIVGVDRLLDMVRTSVNVTGYAVVTCIVAKSEQEIDLEVFADAEAGVLEEIEIDDAVHHTEEK